MSDSERKAMEEVALMKLNYTIERPSTLLSAVCAPSAVLPVHAPVALLVAERAAASQAHQVQIQAELVRTLADVDGSYESTGFVGSNDTSASKRMTVGGSGAPPRGRPV